MAQPLHDPSRAAGEKTAHEKQANLVEEGEHELDDQDDDDENQYQSNPVCQSQGSHGHPEAKAAWGEDQTGTEHPHPVTRQDKSCRHLGKNSHLWTKNADHILVYTRSRRRRTPAEAKDCNTGWLADSKRCMNGQHV